MKKLFLVGAQGLLFTSLALAEHYPASSMNFHIDVGQARQDINPSDFPPGTDIDDEDIAFRAGIGLRTGLLGGNISYINFGQSAVSTPTASAEADTYGLGFDLQLDLPLSEYSSFFVKGGILSWEQVTDEHQAGTNFVTRYREDGADPYWGVGFRFSGAPGMNIKIEYDRFEFKDNGSDVVADYDLVTVGLEFFM
jgi:hypothetical protein